MAFVPDFRSLVLSPHFFQIADKDVPTPQEPSSAGGTPAPEFLPQGGVQEAPGLFIVTNMMKSPLMSFQKPC
jgi:hypothetical protein